MSDDTPAPARAWTRRLNLLRLLIQRGTITTRAAARALDVDRRRALADLHALEEHGVPMSQQGEGRASEWKLEPSWRYLGISIDLQDRLAMLLGRELIGFLRDTDFADAIQRLEGHLEALDPNARVGKELARRFICLHEPEKDYSAHRGALDIIVRALLEGHRISFGYHTARGEVRELIGVGPLTLVIYKRGLYLVFQRGGRHMTWAVERMTNVRPEPNLSFEYPRPSEYNPRALLRSRYGISDDGRPPERVRIRFDAHVKTFVATRTWHPDQEFIELDDGGCELSFVSHGHELAPLVLEFGRTCEVLEPAWLRERVIAELEEALGRYRA